MHNKALFSASFPSSKDERKKCLDEVMQSIRIAGAKITVQINELYLALDEALTNAMEHGNGWDPRKRVTITVRTESTALIIAIEDQGNGFDTRSVSGNPNGDQLASRGRGIKIIRQFCTPRWNTKGNTIELHFALKQT